MKKMYVAMLVAALACGSLFAGCGSNTSENTQSSNVQDREDKDEREDKGDTDRGTGADTDAGSSAGSSLDSGADASNDNSGLMDDITNALQADGRDYGETLQLSQNDVMQSEFFDLKINSVRTADSLEGWTPQDEENYTFLIVNVSITNTFGVDIPMSNYDFEILWGGGEDAGEFNYPDTDFSTALPEQYYIDANDTETGDLIYIVPKSEKEFTLEYYDLWDDDFRGNTFDMHISVK